MIVYFVVIALVLVGWLFYSSVYESKKDFKLITNDEELAEFMQNMKEGDREAYIAWRDEQYAMDSYGGDTPEKTLNLYIEALKVGDMELASKYFRLEDQERELGELMNLNEKQIEDYVLVLGSYKSKTYNETFNMYYLRGENDGEAILLSKMVENNQTGKWKMESL